jgi:CheY-like chemotaxis protein
MKKILLIEDDLPTIELYKTALKAADFDIKTANTASQALARLKEIRERKKEKPDLILLDLILPDMNGKSILKEVKERSETKDILVFILSNYSDPKLYEKLLREGADKFLVKINITPKELVKTVEEALK